MRSSLIAISKNTHDMTSKAVGDEKAGHASPHMIAPWWVNRGRAAAHSQVVVGSFSKMWRSSCARRYYSTHMRMLYAKLGLNWQMMISVKLATLRNHASFLYFYFTELCKGSRILVLTTWPELPSLASEGWAQAHVFPDHMWPHVHLSRQIHFTWDILNGQSGAEWGVGVDCWLPPADQTHHKAPTFRASGSPKKAHPCPINRMKN